MTTEQEFFDDEAWDDWDATDEEVENLYDINREVVWQTFNTLYEGKLAGVSQATKSYLFEDFKRQFFANKFRDEQNK